MWALIQGGVVHEVVATDPAKRFHPSLIWVACPDGVVPGWTCDGKTFAPPVPVAPTPMELVWQAQGALAVSDIVALRCIEAGGAVPADWKAYRASLRLIAGGTSKATALPTPPTKPSGI